MSRPKGDGMCAICKAVPAQLRQGAPSGYCKDCELKYQRERYAAKRTRGKFNWPQRGDKKPNAKPPTDWREVLRKADEAKS